MVLPKNSYERFTMNSLIEVFSHPFMQRALIAGIMLAISAALVGVPLVLKRNSMLSDGLSHVGFGAFAIAAVLGLVPLSVAIPLVIIVSFFILRLEQNSRIHGDALTAIISVSALALGTFIVSLSGSNVDINSYLFGSILSIGDSEIWASLALVLAVLIIFTLFHNQIFAITFDEKFARAIGINTGLFNTIFAILCSCVVVIGMRLMGALLISSLIVFPTLSAKSLFHSFKSVLISSACISCIAFVIGLLLSYTLATPTGATIVLVNLFVLLIAKIIGFINR